MELQLPRQLQEEAVIEGNFSEYDLSLIAQGVKASTQITRAVKKLFE